MRIHTIDLQFQGLPHAIASYLVEGPGGPVLVETGPATTLATLERELGRLGHAVEDVRDVLVTHIHLDHAGAAGWWARRGARVHVHEVGAPHLIDPSKLLRSARRIYGDRLEELWGDVLPAPAERVVAVADGDAIEAGGLRFVALDTPGHAGHHHVYRLEDLAFTGDAASVRLPGCRYIDIPAPPPEFDLELWLTTLERLERERFECLYLTHFDRVDEATEHLQRFRRVLPEAVSFLKERLDAGLEEQDLTDAYLDWHRERAEAEGVDPRSFDQYQAANPAGMSVTGITRYLSKRAG